jgi:hypothetical protein
MIELIRYLLPPLFVVICLGGAAWRLYKYTREHETDHVLSKEEKDFRFLEKAYGPPRAILQVLADSAKDVNIPWSTACQEARTRNLLLISIFPEVMEIQYGRSPQREHIEENIVRDLIYTELIKNFTEVLDGDKSILELNLVTVGQLMVTLYYADHLRDIDVAMADKILHIRDNSIPK